MKPGTAPREELARLLAVDGPKRRHGWVDLDGVDLAVTVAGVGTLPEHISRPKALKLKELGEAAPYGLGEETLIDPAVRHTWRIPDDLVSVDWGGGLDGVLDSARSVLGLPVGTRLSAEFHSMLVYEVGQFFVPHQDSEKADDMVATLVVMLGSAHSGGELVVHGSAGETAYVGHRESASAVVLYADQLHEVRQVTTGHRITLTYNILAHQPETGSADGNDVQQAAELLRRHFRWRPRPRWTGDVPQVPRRLAFLLDHQYTEHSVTWPRLKGADVDRAATLRVAADTADCEIVLGLTEIHEVRDADEDRFVDPDGGLLVSEITVTRWRAIGDADVVPVSLDLNDSEVCAATPTTRLEPDAAEYERFMGNYGNTMDRWYHRGVLLIWPRALAFANRAEADPSWALNDLSARLIAGDRASVRRDLAGMDELWPHLVRSTAIPLNAVIEIAVQLGDAPTARMLLSPFTIEHVTPAEGALLPTLTERYAAPWVLDLVTVWFANRRRPSAGDEWYLGVPELCAAAGEYPEVGRAILRGAWGRLKPLLSAHGQVAPTSWTRAKLLELIGPLAAVLRAATEQRHEATRADIQALLMSVEDFLPVVIGVLDAAQCWPAEVRSAAGGELAAYARGRLQHRLDQPEREPGDWSVRFNPRCDCQQCQELSAFLADPASQSHEWRLAEQLRDHITSTVTQAELPVAHETLRLGRPYTLVLRKTDALFSREAAIRRAAAKDLARLDAAWG